MSSFTEAKVACRSLLLAMGLMVMPTGVVLAQVQWVERPDDMIVYFLEDWDRIGDRVRILYQTKPSLEQYTSDPNGWTNNVYVVEAHPDGTVKQYRLASRQQSYASLTLRSGHDQVFVVPLSDKDGTATVLEVWSSRDGTVVSSNVAPGLPKVHAGHIDITPTSDGNLFATTQRPQGSGRRKPVWLAWIKLSPQGKILGQGVHRHGDAQLATRGTFPARGGGIGLTVQLSANRGSDGIETDIEVPIKRTIGGRTLEARVFSETRMLVTDGLAQRLWISPALERSLMWGGQMQVSSDLSPNEMMEQMQQQMHITESVEIEYAARRTLKHVANANSDAVKWTPGGYGALANVVANRRLEPPAHGPYFVEIGTDGTLRRELYLEPVAKELNAKFMDFLPGDNGDLLLVGTRRATRGREVHGHVTSVDADGGLQWTVRLAVRLGEIDGIAGTESNAWVFGRSALNQWNKTMLWLEKVDKSRVRSRVESAPSRAAPAAKKEKKGSTLVIYS